MTDLSLTALSKKRQQKQNKEVAEKLVGVAKDIETLLKERGLKHFEVGVVLQMLQERLVQLKEAFVAGQLYSDLIKEDGEKKEADKS